MLAPRLLFLAVCAVITFLIGRQFLRALRSRNWPSVPGLMITSRVVKAMSAGKSSSPTYNTLDLAYRYAVNGIDFEGHRVGFDDSDTSSERLRNPHKLAEKTYPAGKAVTVFYDPERPAICTLSKGVPRRLKFCAAIGGMFALLGLL